MSEAEKLFQDANEFYNNDDFDNALKNYTQAIEKCDSSDASTLFNYYIARAQAFLKNDKNAECLQDAEKAVALKPKDSRAYLKKGIANYNLEKYADGLADFQQGKEILNNESEAKLKMFDEWIAKCQKKMPKEEPLPVVTPLTATVVPVPQIPAPIKHEFYQTDSQVIVSILVKNVNSEKVQIQTTEDHLTIESSNQEELKLNLNFHLLHPIDATQTQIKFLPNKIEIKLKKCEVIQWKSLEKNPNDINKQQASIDKPIYPTSSKKPKNWDKIAADVAAEEKDEKLEGDAALNKLFQQVYANGSEETRRAMNKSFVESGGTVLSTNWTDVGAKKLEVKAPDGMEFKKWD